jgi:hypothetical protein
MIRLVNTIDKDLPEDEDILNACEEMIVATTTRPRRGDMMEYTMVVEDHCAKKASVVDVGRCNY